MKIKNYYDNFYYVFFGIYFTICLVFISIILALHVNTLYVVLGIAFLIIILSLIIFFYFRVYRINEKSITIRAGFIKKVIPYKNIKKCFIVSNINPFYSTSYKRIALRLKNGKEIYISPVKMDNTLMQIMRKADKW